MSDNWVECSPLMQLLSGRWTLAVLAELADGGKRYQDIHGAVEGISHKVLTDTLRRAERDGLLSRRVADDRIATATLYQLTSLARSLDEPLSGIAVWVGLHWNMVEDKRRRWDSKEDPVI